MQFTVPRLIKDKHQLFSIVFYVQGKRHRVSNGQRFGLDLHPNKEPFERRLIVAQELQLRIHQALHKPFDDVQAVLAEIREYNENLWLCCLLTYGCLLRPHQEIRQLTWGDFSEDMSFISLSGSRNKSGRNRIVPFNPQIAVHLQRGGHTDNIFTGCETPYNPDYFKTLWGKYKKRSKLLEPNQTLYSFRHTGAIEIYKRTGSLTVLQQAMGHASLAVSLG
ncbi:MAG: tyrosine-type recombinase/integrase, partial [Flavobacteriales bacterium]